MISLASIFVALVFCFSRLVAFAHLFGMFGGHAGTRITQLEIAIEHNSTTPDPRTAVVPKIIHQIFHNWNDPHDNTLPPHWEEARESCIRLNPDWDVKVSRLLEIDEQRPPRRPHLLTLGRETVMGYRELADIYRG